MTLKKKRYPRSDALRKVKERVSLHPCRPPPRKQSSVPRKTFLPVIPHTGEVNVLVPSFPSYAGHCQRDPEYPGVLCDSGGADQQPGLLEGIKGTWILLTMSWIHRETYLQVAGAVSPAGSPNRTTGTPDAPVPYLRPTAPVAGNLRAPPMAVRASLCRRLA